MNTIGPKGKGLVQGPKSPVERESPRDRYWLYIRCRAEMTGKDWNALLAEIPKEAKKRFTFIDLGAGTDHMAHRPKPRSAKGFDRQSSKKEDKKVEGDSRVERVSREPYGQERQRPTQVGQKGWRIPQQGQDAHRGHYNGRGQGAP